MGDSSPELDSADGFMDFDEVSEITAVMKATREVASSQWTLTRSEDQEAPEITCMMEAGDDERSARASRAAGHGPRPLVEAEHVAVTDGPRVVVTIEI